MERKIPVIAIVGRPNVGKSAFFNAAAGSRIAIVDPAAGVTRDRISAELVHEGRRFELIDTGGIGGAEGDRLKEEIESQIDVALHAADGILFLVDIREGILPLDQEVARRLRGLKKPVVLVANKADHGFMVHARHGFMRLGFGEPVAASALERRSVFEALERILEALPAPPPEAEDGAEGGDGPRVAVVGRMNAGKSTLVNRLARGPRVIVSEIPGTTRDSVDVRVEMGDLRFTVIDTAGIRRKRSIQDSVEFYGQARAARAIRRADAVLLLLDATREISSVDKRIAAEVLDSYKPCIVCLNKWDRVDRPPEAFLEYVGARLTGLRFAPVACLSALEGFNVEPTFRLVPELIEQWSRRVETARINKVLREAFTRRPPRTPKSRTAKVYFGTQVDVRPPFIVVFVNDPALFDEAWRRYLAGRFREALPFPEVPIKIAFRGRRREEE